MRESKTDLTKLTPPTDFTDADKLAVLEHVTRRLAAHRNKAELYARTEAILSSAKEAEQTVDAFMAEIDKWAEELLRHAWTALGELGGV